MMKGKVANWCRRVGASALSIAMAVGGLGLTPMQAVAENNDTDEIMLASFWTSFWDSSDTLYFSTDGINFYEICEAYTDATPTDRDHDEITMARHNYRYADAEEIGNEPGGINGFQADPQVLRIDEKGNYVAEAIVTTNDQTLHDPSIMYKDGYFWMISGYTPGVGAERRVSTLLGFSKDLIHWSFPNSGSSSNIKLSEVPNIDRERNPYYNPDEWNMVAPDMFLDDNGDVYILFSIGYFGLLHPEDTRENKIEFDEMYPYICKITDIQMPLYADTSDPSKAYVPDPAKFPELSENLKITYTDATPIKLPCMTTRSSVAHDHIDASLYKEGEYYYYSIKENGVTNEIWRTKDLSKAGDPSSWEEVSYDVVTGYEGPCLTKFGGQYFFYVDRLASFRSTNLNGDQAAEPFGSEGTYVIKANTETTGKLDQYTGWLEDNIKEIKTYAKDGSIKKNRHGSVITLTGEAAKAVRDAARSVGYSDDKLFGTWNPADWTNTGWYQKETYLDQVIHGEDVEFYKYYYVDGKRVGASVTGTGIGTERIIDDNPYFFKADGSDPNKDGKMFCSSAHDGYAKGEVVAKLPVDWAYYNEVGAEAYGNDNWAWTCKRYDWRGQLIKCVDNIEEGIPGRYQDGKTGKWYRYDPVTGDMVKGAFHYVNKAGDGCVIWFDPETGEQVMGGENASFETWRDTKNTDDFAKFTVNRREYMVDKYGTLWYFRYDLVANGVVTGPFLQNVTEAGALPTVEYHSPKLDILEEEGHPTEGYAWYKPDGEEGAWYWYENGVRQGTTIDPQGVYGIDRESGKSINRGREIAYNNMWYWLDSDAQGKRAVGKEVWVPYIFQDEGTWNKEKIEEVANLSDPCMVNYVCQCMLTSTGKWVRYDENGQMLKGWVTIEGALADIYTAQKGNTYYYDTRTGLMAKGWIKMDDDVYYFDEISGVLQKEEREINGVVYKFNAEGKCENPPANI